MTIAETAHLDTPRDRGDNSPEKERKPSMAERSARRVIATEAADQSEAISFLPEDHSGPCALSYCGRTGTDWAIFSTAREGERAAAFAIRLDIGGYSDVAVHPTEAAPPETPTYDDAWTWLDGE